MFSSRPNDAEGIESTPEVDEYTPYAAANVTDQLVRKNFKRRAAVTASRPPAVQRGKSCSDEYHL
jgi:hypothetical protein